MEIAEGDLNSAIRDGNLEKVKTLLETFTVSEVFEE